MTICDHPSFEATLAAVAAEGRKCAELYRLAQFAQNRRYRHNLAFMVAAEIETLESYRAEWRTFQDERNVRCVARYFRKYPLQQMKRAA